MTTPRKTLERHELENTEIKYLLNRLGRLIGKDLPEGWGFTLLLFEFSPKDSLFYISNGKRQDMIRTMREFIKRHGEN